MLKSSLELSGSVGSVDVCRAEREEYLAELTLCLQERLSPLDTYDQVTEIRSHLDSMAEAYVEMGTPAAIAMAPCVGTCRRFAHTR